MTELKFYTDENIKNQLQTLAVETESHQSLIAFMLMHDMVNSPNFIKYQDEYKKYFAQYEQAKTKFQKEVVNPVLQQHNIDAVHASWSLDFATNEVVITVAD